MHRPSLVIFDCDGVLVDTEPLAAEVLRVTLAELGLPLTQGEVDRRYRGRSLRDCVLLIEDSLGRRLPEDFVPRLNERTFTAFDAEGVRPIPFVREGLEALRAAGVPCCVASSGGLEKMRKTLGLAGLLEMLEPHLFSASMVGRGKPAPDLFLHAAAHFGAEASTCVVVEDSLPGALAGRAAGMRTLGYAADGSDELEEAGAVLFRSMKELPTLLGL